MEKNTGGPRATKLQSRIIRVDAEWVRNETRPIYCELVAKAFGEDLIPKFSPCEMGPGAIDVGPKTKESDVDPPMSPINDDESETLRANPIAELKPEPRTQQCHTRFRGRHGVAEHLQQSARVFDGGREMF